MSRKDKWSKYSYLNRSKHLTPYLPQMKRLNRRTFREFINKYDQVILKPIVGSGGFGVIQVSSLANEHYEIHREKQRIKLKGKNRAYNYIDWRINTAKYMIQRRIPLATVNNRPFDMRIIVQRKKQTNLWKVTARAAKVAGKGYIVTNNTRSKGTMLHVATAIKRSSLKRHSLQNLLTKIDKVALLAAKRLSVFFPRHCIYGIDMGLDQNGHVWIIETHHYPAMSHFRKLGNKAMYRRIMSYKIG